MSKTPKRLKPHHCRPLKPYVAIVEGAQDGVPFRCKYKELRAAERDAQKTGGTLTEIPNFRSRVWIKHSHVAGDGHWREAL